MISNKKPKSNKKLIIISVIVLTILTLNVSYSAFFDVKLQSNINSFTSGTLDVTVVQNSTASGEMLPVSDSSLPTTSSTAINSGWKFSQITLTNNGSLPADFMVTLTYGDTTAADRISLQYLNIGIHDGSKWLTIGNSGKYFAKISSIVPTTTNVYPIIRDKLTTDTTGKQKTYKIFLWLSQNTPVSEINKKINLKISVRSTTVEGQSSNNGQSNVTVN